MYVAATFAALVRKANSIPEPTKATQAVAAAGLFEAGIGTSNHLLKAVALQELHDVRTCTHTII